MSKKKNLAILETPNQCLFLRCIFNHEINDIDFFFVKRPKYKNNIYSFKKYFEKNFSIIGNLQDAVFFIIKNFNKYDKIILGSHLGIGNKIIILISLSLNLNLVILDDGSYSLKKQKWIVFIGSVFKKFKWFSYYNRDLKKKFLINYCMTSLIKNNNYQRTLFFVGPNIVKFTEKLEIKILNYLNSMAKKKNMKFVVFPHRLGRNYLYEKMQLSVIKHHICFEDWYLNSNFENCRLIASNSSIWRVFEDQRIHTTMICKKKDKKDYRKLDLNSIYNYKNINDIIELEDL